MSVKPVTTPSSWFQDVDAPEAEGTAAPFSVERSITEEREALKARREEIKTFVSELRARINTEDTGVGSIKAEEVTKIEGTLAISDEALKEMLESGALQKQIDAAEKAGGCCAPAEIKVEKAPFAIEPTTVLAAAPPVVPATAPPSATTAPVQPATASAATAATARTNQPVNTTRASTSANTAAPASPAPVLARTNAAQPPVANPELQRDYAAAMAAMEEVIAGIRSTATPTMFGVRPK